MNELVVVLTVMSWFIMGGWSFSILVEDATDTHQVGGLLGFCLLLAPFAFGIALCRRFQP